MGWLELLCQSLVLHGRQHWPHRGHSQPLLSSPCALGSAGTTLCWSGWIQLFRRGMSVCLIAPEPGPSCWLRVRPEAAELCCGLGSPAPAVPPSTFSHRNACSEGSEQVEPLSPCGRLGSSPPPHPCQLMGRARHCLCCSLKSSVWCRVKNILFSCYQRGVFFGASARGVLYTSIHLFQPHFCV